MHGAHVLLLALDTRDLPLAPNTSTAAPADEEQAHLELADLSSCSRELGHSEILIRLFHVSQLPSEVNFERFAGLQLILQPAVLGLRHLQLPLCLCVQVRVGNRPMLAHLRGSRMWLNTTLYLCKFYFEISDVRAEGGERGLHSASLALLVDAVLLEPFGVLQHASLATHRFQHLLVQRGILLFEQLEPAKVSRAIRLSIHSLSAKTRARRAKRRSHTRTKRYRDVLAISNFTSSSHSAQNGHRGLHRLSLFSSPLATLRQEMAPGETVYVRRDRLGLARSSMLWFNLINRSC